jgi:hypothetical protein
MRKIFSNETDFQMTLRNFLAGFNLIPAGVVFTQTLSLPAQNKKR